MQGGVFAAARQSNGLAGAGDNVRQAGFWDRVQERQGVVGSGIGADLRRVVAGRVQRQAGLAF